jgi:hypothetical protein
MIAKPCPSTSNNYHSKSRFYISMNKPSIIQNDHLNNNENRTDDDYGGGGK